MPGERAALLAELLTANDLRGVLSHGTQQLATYVRLVRDGSLNPAPEPTVVRETANSLLVDGDGGLDAAVVQAALDGGCGGGDEDEQRRGGGAGAGFGAQRWGCGLC